MFWKSYDIITSNETLLIIKIWDNTQFETLLTVITFIGWRVTHTYFQIIKNFKWLVGPWMLILFYFSECILDEWYTENSEIDCLQA